ncbi:MAG: Rieske 2Fe-2S domain-containing protein [Acidobacteria bacterium]|nr:Rieske 2Fe-2S domain-containing protein [Acidobacteriota bacterium]
MTRRGLYQGAIFVLGGLIGAGLGVPAAAYLLLGQKKDEDAEGWIDAGPLQALPLGQPTRLILERQRQDAWRRDVEKAPVWVIRDGDAITAFSPKCPHLGCGVSWSSEEKVFECPCHDSTFARDGKVEGGPSPRGLDTHETRIEGDRLWLGPIHEGEPA